VKQLHNSEASGDPDVGVAVERLFELAVLLGDAMERGLAERGLTLARAELLWRLRRQGPMTQRALSESLRCTPRNVTGLVDALEASGLVVRRPHPTDRRATLVTLSNPGSGLAATMDEGYQETASHLFDDLGPEALSVFIAGMDHVLERLRAPSRSSGAR